jgi:hypothetical protein
MKWFKKFKVSPNNMPASMAGSKIQVETQMLAKIKNMCAVTTASAKSVAQSSYDDLAKEEKQRFESAKRMSLELAKNITDVSCRDTAFLHIFELCMKANDTETARILVRGIQTGSLREKLLEEYPQAFH